MVKEMNDYLEFVAGKAEMAEEMGFACEPSEVNAVLLPHQRDIVVWAVRGGRRAIFAAFGLGKTVMQLEVVRLCLLKAADGAGKDGAAKQRAGQVPPVLRGLIICPLGVRQEFARDARMLGLEEPLYVRNDEEVKAAAAGRILLTNYERVRDGGISPELIDVVSLDEASVLRGYGTKTYQEFLALFPCVPWRFVATATPSPNRFKELIHYAGFLGIMDTGEALTRFFQRDSTKANELTLYPHRARDFWMWLKSWACFVQKPSDLGHSDVGFDLPGLRVVWHEVPVDHSLAKIDKRDGQALMFRDSAGNLQDAAREKRLTLGARVAKMREILDAEPDEHFILWHHLEDERRAIAEAVPGCLEIFGTLDLDVREERVVDFAEGRGQYLATKPELSGSGCNFQRHCARMVFVGIDYKFNDFIQSIHRLFRFMQTREVVVHIIYAESERDVRAVLEEKWGRHKVLTEEMAALIREFGLAHDPVADVRRALGVKRIEATGRNWLAVNNDCVEELRGMDSESVDLICTSIPFGNHYEYSANYNDFGHNLDNEAFFKQMDFLSAHLLRVLRPGRVYACHVKDRILFGNATGTGMPTVDPFHAFTIIHYIKHGFEFFGMITIETDVVRENNQTYRLGWTEQCKDGSKMGVGCPEYLLLFRKLPTDRSKAYADVKVSKSKAAYTRGKWQIDARAKWNSSGNRLLTSREIGALGVDGIGRLFGDRMRDRVYSYEEHVALANEMDELGKLPATFECLKVPARSEWVWDDVLRMRTLNGDQTRKGLQNHICPLQFDIVDRVIERFSNPGDTVLDPFGGIMTVPYRAVLKGRRGIGVELNAEYWKDGCAYLRAADVERATPTLFDLEGMPEEKMKEKTEEDSTTDEHGLTRMEDLEVGV